MKITKKEVKTIVSIQVDAKDIQKAFDDALNNFSRLGKDSFTCIHGEAFKSIIEKGEDNLAKEIWDYNEKVIKHVWGTKELGETLRYVVKFLGFDGIENCGMYRENCQARCMTVYMEGNTL